MSQGYVRQDVANQIANGNVTDADPIDNEFDAIEIAFHVVEGHTHDGTTAQGAPITRLGPEQDIIVGSVNVVPKTHDVLNIGLESVRFRNAWFSGTITGNLSGSATTLSTPRNFSITGGATASAVSFNGSSNVALNVTSLSASALTGTIDNARIPTTLTSKTFSGDVNEILVIKPATTPSSQGIYWKNADGSANLMGVGYRQAGPNFVVTDGSSVGSLENAKFRVDLGTGNIVWTGAATGNIAASNLTGTISPDRLPVSNTAEVWLGNLFADTMENTNNKGRLAFCKNVSGSSINNGESVSGSALRYSSTSLNEGNTPGGTWLCLGSCPTGHATLFVRTLGS